MDAKRYRQIRQLFDSVMEQPVPQRLAYLDEAGKDDTELREEVRRLVVNSDRRTEVFEEPVMVRLGPGPLQRWEGRRLGPYQILRELGEGGMGIVYLARRADGAFEKEVAIKIVRQELATPQFLARFQRERDILARLEHPHIARLLDGGTSPAFLAMEYVKGEPLLAYADSRRLDYDGRLALLRQISSAVDYAHKQGVIHRDLKPANIFVTADGEVKLLDFGIAAWQQADGESEISPTIAMSPAYASPEQVRGDKTNHATDIYSLGLIAYELMAGVQPFRVKEAAMAEVFRVVLEEMPAPPSVAVRDSTDPRPSELGRRRQMTPVDLITRLEQVDGAVLKAIAKRREDRPATAAELVDELGTRVPVSTGNRWSWWIQQFHRNSDLLAANALFVWLAAIGQLNPTPVAWWILLGVSLLALVYRFGLFQALDRRFLRSDTQGFLPTMLIIILSLGFSSRVDTLKGDPMQKGLMSGVLAMLIGLLILRYWNYHRRAQVLGSLLLQYQPKPKWDAIAMVTSVGILLPVVLSVFGARYGSHSGLFLLLTPLTWRGKPFEVREKGVVVNGNSLLWGSIHEYRWVNGNEVHFQLRERPFLTPQEVVATVDVRRRDHVQTLLEDWLREAPERGMFAPLEI